MPVSFMLWMAWSGCSGGSPTLTADDAAAVRALETACGCTLAVRPDGEEGGAQSVSVRERRIVSLTLGSPALDSTHLDGLAALDELTHLDLSSSAVNTLTTLPALPALRELDLSNTPLTSLSGLESTSITWLNVSHTRLTTLQGLPSTVEILLAHGMDLPLPEGHTPGQVSMAPPTPSPESARQAARTLLAPYAPPPAGPSDAPIHRPEALELTLHTDTWKQARRGSASSSHNGLTGTHSGTLSEGSGHLRIELDGLQRSAGVVDLTLRSGSARIWLQDADGTWVAYPLAPGRTQVHGHFATAALDHYFLIDAPEGFEGLSWTVQ